MRSRHSHIHVQRRAGADIRTWKFLALFICAFSLRFLRPLRSNGLRFSRGPVVPWSRGPVVPWSRLLRSEEHTSEPQSLMRTLYAVICLKEKTTRRNTNYNSKHLHIISQITS